MMFNNGVWRKCAKDSVIRCAATVHSKLKSIYIDGSHAKPQALSYYNRPSHRNNQSLEAQNLHTVRLGDACSESVRGSFERWIQVAKKQERLFANRIQEIKRGKKPNTKRPNLRNLDQRIKGIIRSHKEGRRSLHEYWNEIIKLKSDYELK